MGKKELVGVALFGGGYGLVALSLTWWVDRWTGGNLAVAVTVLGVIGTVGAVIGWRAAVRAETVPESWAELYRLLDQWRRWADEMDSHAARRRGHIAGSGTVRSAMARANEARACAKDLEGVLTGLKDRT